MDLKSVVLLFLFTSTLSSNLLKYSAPEKSNVSCDFTSLVISAETESNVKYNLLMSFSTKESRIDCQYTCEVNQDSNIIVGELVDNYEYSRRFYTFYKFKGLKNYIEYTYLCYANGKVKSGKVQFPKGDKNVAKIITFGDWSKNKYGQNTFDEIKAKSAVSDATVFLGDLAYDMEDDNGEVGNDFLSFAQEATRAIPFQLTTGNHENGNGFMELKKRFLMPNKKVSENLYYSYDIKNTHFVSVNSEASKKSLGKNYIKKIQEWLENDLKQTKMKWKVIYLHRPFYCSLDNDSHCGSSSENMRNIYEEIIHKYKVDLVLTGHTHAYERTFPIHNSIVDKTGVSKDENTYSNPKYPTHIVCGTGGNAEGFTKYVKKDFAKVTYAFNGICEVEFTDNEIRFRYIDISKGLGKEVERDSFKIVKNN